MFSKRFLLVFFTIFLVTFLAACGNKDDSVIHMDPSDLRPVPTLEFAISDTDSVPENSFFIPVVGNGNEISVSEVSQVPTYIKAGDVLILSEYDRNENVVTYQAFPGPGELNCQFEGEDQAGGGDSSINTALLLVSTGGSDMDYVMNMVYDNQFADEENPPGAGYML